MDALFIYKRKIAAHRMVCFHLSPHVQLSWDLWFAENISNCDRCYCAAEVVGWNEIWSRDICVAVARSVSVVCRSAGCQRQGRCGDQNAPVEICIASCGNRQTDMPHMAMMP